MSDLVLLYILTGLLFLAAVLKLGLAKKKNEDLSALWKVQRFIFPVGMLVVLILFQTGIADWVIPGVFLGVLEEFVFRIIRKKRTER